MSWRSLLLNICFVPIALYAGNPKAAFLHETLVFNPPPKAHCHSASLCETADGKILCVCYCYDTNSPENPDTNLWQAEWSGGSWKKPIEIASAISAKGDSVPCWDPVLFKMPDSEELLLFYKVGNNSLSWTGFIKRSFDNGHSWSAPETLPSGIIGPHKNKPLWLDGRLLCPTSSESWQACSSWIDVTSDGGRSWYKIGPIAIADEPEGIYQPALFQDQNEHLQLICCSKKTPRIAQSTSLDKGSTWSAPKFLDIPNPNGPLDLLPLDSGIVLMVYNHSEDSSNPLRRTPLNMALSRDNGQTWQYNVVCFEDSNGDYSHPNLILGSDGLIHLTYTYNRQNIKHIVIDPIKLLHEIDS